MAGISQIYADGFARDLIPRSTAPTFLSSTSYAVGDYVYYQGNLYRCTTAHTGTWVASHFTAVTVGSELKAKEASLQSEIDDVKTDLGDVKTFLDGENRYNYGRNIDYTGKSTSVHTVTRYLPEELTPFFPLPYDKFELLANRSSLISVILTFPDELKSKKVVADFWVKNVTNMQFRMWFITDGTNHYFASYPETSFWVGRTFVVDGITWEIDYKYGDWWHFKVTIPNTGATYTKMCIGTSSGNLGGYYYFSKVRLVLDDSAWYIDYPAFSVSSSSDSNMMIQYKTGTGQDSSQEWVDVYVPQNKYYIKYELVHTVKADINSDVWRIAYAYVTDENLTVLYPLTTAGEWEMALHLPDRDDFSGGYAHGDEVLISPATFYVDGQEVTISEYSTLTEVKAFNVVERSNVYDPSEQTRIIAKHGSNHVFTLEGLAIQQSVFWLVDTSLTNCYLAMLPIAKAVTSKYYTNAQQTVTEIGNTSHTEVYATDATIYGNTGVSCRFYVDKYPEIGYFFVTDNGGSYYNKCYFAVKTASGVTHGDAWISETKYVFTLT